ncbi:cytochrome c oxidase subunit IVB [Priestia taiwanensis]|uniref:Cytochrome c oxidase subunit IVB n=1 Tax=Priestia taiwanensis TaxID=1347902 RepID=A0A917APV9_9BACI|nr:cytochrome c oxidase subunit IVB [Priestia taiwanensis]MBM7362969.1 cytochrome c oxidase subunit 4 [Priestia taiwanensis]GGE66570.1 cytochrome c oxidase subunit IVB [Priestia taiwanensis]
MATENSHVELTYRRKKSKEEMKHQVITFATMIFLTLVAFAAVMFQDKLNPIFVVPFILVLASIQVVFQLYYFMHMKHKGHDTIAFFLYSGLIIGFITILAFVTIIWI